MHKNRFGESRLVISGQIDFSTIFNTFNYGDWLHLKEAISRKGVPTEVHMY